MKKLFFLIFFYLFISGIYSQTRNKYDKYVPDDMCISAEAMKLYLNVNQYRDKYNLPPIPLSKALCHVAQLHAEDMELKLKKLTHAWSTCKYQDHIPKTYYCMWDKPKELTNYNSTGYECAHGGTGNYIATAESSLSGWKNSKHHNNVILNKNIWKDNSWNAIGVGIYGGFATLWFGELSDQDGSPEVCPE